MLVILLLITQTTCEWVEISQNYHRQEPPRKIIHHSTQIKHEDLKKDFGNYRNSSVDKQTNKGMIDRVFNVGAIRRVDVPQVKTPRKPNPAEVFYKHNSGATELANQQVSIYKPFQDTTQLNIRNRENTNNLNSHRKVSTSEERNNKNVESDENKIFKTQVIHKRLETSESDSNENDDFDNSDIFKSYERILHPKENKFLKENIESMTTTAIPNDKRIKEVFGLNNQKELYMSEIKPIKSDTFSSNKTVKNKPKLKLTDDFFENIEDRSSETIPSSTPTKTLPRMDFKTIQGKSKTVKEDNKERVEHDLEDSNATKADTMNGMWKLMKVVSDTIYKNTHRSFKSKIKYLERLKTTIITSIEEYVESVWPDDVEHRESSRRIRSAQARGHLEIPSSESTLMTISFLTFAVFLIKLVLQVIHTYKNKTMMVTPAVVAAVGRAAAAIKSKQ